MNWYERACKQIEQEYEDGLMTPEEYRRAMRDLSDELQQEAEDAATSAYNSVIGGW